MGFGMVQQLGELAALIFLRPLGGLAFVYAPALAIDQFAKARQWVTFELEPIRFLNG
jgi:hypothetical protein